MNIELIRWVDSMGCPGGWVHESDSECYVADVLSVGYVRKETDDFVFLVPHIVNSEDVQIAGQYCIPHSQIKERKVIFSDSSCPPCQVSD